ncbi:hypothetical protein J27TS8_02560 [Robertmurraya siralis]|uniref:LiaI-LiaF-like transmembrane region domain-containing protein n=1 Tax=Robertmurraya siralis TaxID=77777 RepID=A0A919WED3_9BACI|nr:DUF5668 domain-containing protein [Robertmurraya siralis]GIN60263.1 hypothetical protein J27TS8_02560 [Robertmurraya siralis]
MKNQRIFPGIILLGFGGYFFLEQANITLFDGLHTWPTLLIIVGLAFLFQGYLAKDYDAILPGVILAGFGLHFHVIKHLTIWPNSTGAFILIIALGFLLRYQKVGSGLFQGLLFLVLAIMLLFYEKIIGWLGFFENGITSVLNYWPILFIGFGVYLLFVRSK